MNIQKSGREERRFQIVVTTDKAGIEHFTIERLLDLTRTPHGILPDDQLIELACRIYDSRRARADFFQGSRFGEPMWDMLLALFCLPSRHERLTVTGVSLAADIPPTTGLRWTRTMERHGLVERVPDPKDGRRIYLELSARGEQMMREYLSTIYHQLTASGN